MPPEIRPSMANIKMPAYSPQDTSMTHSHIVKVVM